MKKESKNRKCLSPDDKIKFLDYPCLNSNMDCRKYLWNSSCKSFKRREVSAMRLKKCSNVNYKKRHAKYHIINGIIYKLYGKYTSRNVHPDGNPLQDEAMKIKEQHDKEELSHFSAWNRWLKTWKTAYRIRVTRPFGEADDMSLTTVQAWTELVPELYEVYELHNHYKYYVR